MKTKLEKLVDQTVGLVEREFWTPKPGTKVLNMETDPLIRATKKAYKNSATGKLEALYAERSRWSRKQTIARNKLAEVDAKIAQAALELAKQIDGVKPEEGKQS